MASDDLQAGLTSPSQLFTAIEDELRDVRRVQSQGQEDDLRLALQLVISRVEELFSKLKEAYKDHAELETSLNLAKSNLQLVQSNNEMLEEALKRDTSGSKDVGWRRVSARDADHRFSDDMPRNVDHGYDYRRLDASPALLSPPVSGRGGMSIFSPPVSGQDSRFFKFRFNNGASPRPTTPNAASPAVNGFAHLTSPSLPSLPSQLNRELEELNAELQRERAARKAAIKEKVDLEAEIESLSQALFEEANKMVASERIRRAETEEELNQTRLEKEALKSALRLIESENGRLRSVGTMSEEDQQPHSSRSSSRAAIKSRPSSTSSIQSSPKSSKFALEPPSSAPASYPPSPPPEPSESTSTPVASPAPASEELTPQEKAQFPAPLHLVANEQRTWSDTRRKPEQLKSASLFPIVPFSS